MKYTLLSALALAASLGVGALLCALLQRVMRREWAPGRRVATSAALGVAVALAAAGTYLATYHRADPLALGVLDSDERVEVRAIDAGILFDGAGESTALVFFPGARVQTEAYAPLMRRIAEGGVDCVLVDPPARIAVLGVGQGARALDELGYEHWIAGGHSLGGVAACGLADDAGEVVDGIVLLASYPTSEVGRDVALLSIYGSEDTVLEADRYEDGKAFWPADSREVVIEGGNHSGYGNYGIQGDDGTATISAEEQQDQTARAVIDLARKVAD
ncbi:MAG: alpha/beta hydrolase [Coriobacteriales bacterium]|nr:alpha/beta hydrolase [Coriobacteriales bacterium]